MPVYGGNGITGRHDEALIDKPTLVIGRVGAHCGNVHLTQGPAWITNNAIFASRIDESLSPRFAKLVFAAARLNRRSGGSGQPFANQRMLNDTSIPLPPMEEQQRIITEVDRRLSLADAADRAVSAGLAKAKRLRQAILKRAFEGKLVPQDPNDEPASVLLERIKANRLPPW